MKLMEFRTRAVAASLSIATRTLFFFFVSLVVYSSSTGEQSIVFFQLLFLQTVLITFLSASSYFRMLETHKKINAISSIGGHLLFSIAGSVLLPILYIVIFSKNEHLIIYFLLGIGAGAASISGALTGHTLQQGRTNLAFAPSIFSALICLVLVLLNPGNSLATYLFTVALYQTLTAVFLAFINASLLRQIFLTGPKLLIGQFITHLKLNLLFGGVNTYAVFLLYLFREEWSLYVAPQIAASAFFFIRLSDIGLQLITTVFASHEKLSYLPRIVNLKIVIAILICFAICIQLLDLDINFGHKNLYHSINSLTSQVLIDFIRYPLALLFLYQVSKSSRTDYGWFVFIPITLVHVLAIKMHWANENNGIYWFMLTTSILGLLVFYFQNHVLRKKTHR